MDQKFRKNDWPKYASSDSDAKSQFMTAPAELKKNGWKCGGNWPHKVE